MNKLEIKGFFDKNTSTWTYIVWSEQDVSRKCAIIDSVLDYDISSGKISTNSADLLISFIKEKNLTLEWILETHIHADHLTAAGYLKDQLGGKTGITKRISKILKTWQKILNNQSDTPLTGEQFDYLFAENEEFKIGNFSAKIISTPGHTPADSCFVIGESIFVGDTIFLPDVGTGRCDFPDGSASDSFDSIKKIFSFPDHYKIYVGHDYPPNNREVAYVTTVREQKNKNIRANEQIRKEIFTQKRNSDDLGKSVPKLLFPAIQVNLRAGRFGNFENGTQYIKIPISF
jgi:glyoxylase-like metal-dependent hydrolase (beta-lactamase superfamily II)